MSIIAGLDIGSTKVVEVVAKAGPAGDIQVLGVGQAPCQGLRRGLVTDVSAVAAAIKAASKRACQAAGVDARRVYVGIPATYIASVGTRGVAAVSGQDGLVSGSDMRRALDAAGVLAVPPDREIVSVLPREYIVDGVGGVRNPEGMAGIRLEVDARVVTGPAAALENIAASVDQAGLSTQGRVLEPVALARAVLAADEVERGVLLVDVGGQITQVALFCEGVPAYFAWVPAGGVHVTNDVAVGMKIPVDQAERTKRKGRPGDDLLRAIIDARLREIVELIEERTAEVRRRGLAPCGVVFTGGGSLTPGLVEMGAEVLGLPARLGSPKGVAPLELGGAEGSEGSEGTDGAGMASCTALGIVKYVASDSVLRLSRDVRTSPIREALLAVRGWFSDFVRDFF